MRQTTGQKLKTKLKLKNFEYVRIRRLVTSSSSRIYQIVFDSRRPTYPLTTYKLRSSKLTPKVVAGSGKEYSGTPWADLENFNGNLSPALFFVTDLSGFYGKEGNYSEKFVQYTNRLEELTIPQLKSVETYTSDTTKKWKTQRKKYQGQGVKNTKLMDSEYIEETGSIKFVFLTESTEVAKDRQSHRTTSSKTDDKKFYDKGSDSLELNPSKTYDMYLQLENVFPNNYYTDISWLEVYNGEQVDGKMMKELLEVADVKLYDTTPAFQFQGFRYRLSQTGSSIFPEDRPDTVWRAKHGDAGLLDKHFSQLFDAGTLGFFLNQMTSVLVKKTKELNYASIVGGKLIIDIS